MSDDDKHGGLRGMMDRTTEMVGGMAGTAAAASAGSSSAGEFVKRASVGNLYEIKAAEMALKRGKSDAVRAFASRMIHDHTTGKHQLQSTLRSFQQPPEMPTELDTRHAQMLDHLEKAPDEDFDGRYMEQQDLAHQETVTLFRGYSESGDDPRLRMFASGTLPALQRHQSMVRQLR